MKILLLGEYSNVHATLAEGLRALGHNVIVASDGDGWKDYRRDIDLRRPASGGRAAMAAYYLSLWKKFLSFRGYDIVQIINPVFIPLKAERIMPFYRFLRRYNRKIVMGAFGMDYYYIDACLDCRTFRYSDFNIGERIRHYPLGDAFIADWHEGEKGRLCRAVAEDSDKIVAGLYEYFASYVRAFPQKLSYIPFPIKPKADVHVDGSKEKVTFFAGVQKGKEEYKGTDVMLRALNRLAADFPERCVVEAVENLPFSEYRRRLRGSDVLLDQLYSYTPAMNALEAMSQGIVVVSGGEPENYEILGERMLRPIVNVLPDGQDVYEKLRHILLHPDELPRLKREGLEYIRIHHDAGRVAARYAETYEELLKT